MNAIEEAETLFQQADGLRGRLVEERQSLLAKVEEIDRMIAKLPGSQEQPNPVSLDEWKARRKRLKAEDVGRAGQPLNSRDIMHATALFFGMMPAKLSGHDRFASVARARHVAMYIARKLTGESFPELAVTFGNRDHTTVIAGVRKIDDQLPGDAELRAEVEEIERVLAESQAARAAIGLELVGGGWLNDGSPDVPGGSQGASGSPGATSERSQRGPSGGGTRRGGRPGARALVQTPVAGDRRGRSVGRDARVHGDPREVRVVNAARAGAPEDRDVSFDDLHEGVLAIFADAQERADGSLGDLANGLQLDTWTALCLEERAAYRAWRAPRTSPGAHIVVRADQPRVYLDVPPIVNEQRRCVRCGGAIEVRPGCHRSVHLGKYKGCPRPMLARVA